MAYETTADSTPLADALAQIAALTDVSESDAEVMMQLLGQIESLCIVARNEYLQNVLDASRREKDALKASSAAR